LFFLDVNGGMGKKLSEGMMNTNVLIFLFWRPFVIRQSPGNWQKSPKFKSLIGKPFMRIHYTKQNLNRCSFNTRTWITLCLCISSFIFSGCSDKNIEESLTIESETILDSIPSGSGLAIHNDIVYIIGDDATGVYTLNPENLSQSKTAIPGFVYSEYRQPKETKHDFESATLISWQNKQFLLAFGSGSKKNFRDSLLVFNINNHNDQRIFSLTQFYGELQRQTVTDPSQWNVEGSTVTSQDLLLCNRGNNLIIKLPLKEFLEYVLDDHPTLPNASYHQVKLPMIDDKEARFSGMCTFNDSIILFCASVEDTPDWIQDGPVMGSYIGIYSISENKLVASFLLKDKQGKVLKEKIESIDILNRDSESISLLAIADNDNGSSKLFRLRLRLDSFK